MLDGTADDYLKPVCFPTFLDWFLGKLDALETDTVPEVRSSAQQTASGNDSELYQPSAFQAKMRTKTNGMVYRVVVAALARPDEQRLLSPLCSMLSSLIPDVAMYCAFSSLVSPFFADTRSARSRGRVVANSFCAVVAVRLEQVMDTSSVAIVSRVTTSSKKNLSPLSGGDIFNAPRQHFAKLSDRNAHRNG